jgi:hypothetical protein
LAIENHQQCNIEPGNAWLDCHINFILQCNISIPRYLPPDKGSAMSQDWNTKYGPRRVRRDPPTLAEAIFAAAGITDDQNEQAEIAASLMGMPIEAVTAEVKKAGRSLVRSSSTRVIAGEQGAQRSVVVERRVVRKFGNDKRTGT